MDATARCSSPPAALRLLSLDGGGIRGISALIMLQEIMHRVQRTEKLSSAPLPADYFDLICGTSTGGLIALLLGRLRLSVPEAIDKYRILAKQVFSVKKVRGKDGTFKASNLEKAIKDVVQGKLGDADERMFVANGGCKTFVCAVPAKHINKEPRLFRTWSAATNPGYNCTIWEAARATSAAPTFFKRIYIGDPGLQEEFIDAGIGCNNPVRYLMEEAQREFGPTREVSCIVSIGTGKPKVAGFEKPGLLQRTLPLDLIKVLASLATDSEAEAAAITARYQNCPSLYYRLNVERGLEEVSLEEWDKLGDVKTHTMAYLGGSDVSNNVDAIVTALVGRSQQTYHLGQLGGAAPGPSSTPYHFKYPSSRKVNHFVSRIRPQEEIQQHFQIPKGTAVPTVVVLTGIGGCGKSQLALECCQKSQNRKSYSVIFWIDATSPTTVKQSLNALAQELSKPGFDAKDVEENVQFIITKLSTWQGRWLLVFDNFDNLHSFGSNGIKEYFPQSNTGFIIVTSRDRAAKGLGYTIDVSIMSKEEALELLFCRSEAAKSNENLLEARKIVERLGFYALAIDQAGAYIFARALDLDLFMEHYNKRRVDVLNETPGLWDYTRKLEDNPEIETNLTAFTTWELSFDLITGDRETRDDKEHILTLLAFFDRNEISDTLFKPYYSQNSSWMTSCIRDGVWDEYKFQDILKELRNLSLIQSLRIQKSGASLSLHPLVQDWIKLRISLDSRQAYTTEAILVLSDFIRARRFHEIPLNTKQAVFFHLEQVIRNEQEYLSEQDYFRDANMLNASSLFVLFLDDLGRYKAAEELCRRVLKGTEGLLGKEHPDTLISISKLASLLESQGKYNEAEPMHRQALALSETVLGKEHPATLTSMNNLALLLESQAKYNEAEPMHRQALALRETVLGKEHPATLTSMNNLALLLERQGKYNEAEPMYRQALALRETVLGKEHPATLISMDNLASLLKIQGKYDKAEPMHQQALALSETVLGKEHPDTLISMNNLASLLKSQGKYNEAKPMHRQALALSETVLGKEHPATLISMDNLASLLKSQGKYDEAEPMHRQALALSETVLGKEHPDTLISMDNLASLLKIQGKYDKAEPMHQQALALSETVLGKEHPDTLISMNNLASLLKSQGKYNEAEPMHRQALALSETVLGKEHPDTLISMDNLASLLKIQGKYDEAEPMHRQALALRETVLGKEHPDTLISMNNLALLLESQAKYNEAEPMHRQALALRETVLGKEHPATLISMNNLASLLESQGKHNEANQLFEARARILGLENPSHRSSQWREKRKKRRWLW